MTHSLVFSFFIGKTIHISDSARTTRQTILEGFEKATTANIFMHG